MKTTRTQVLAIGLCASLSGWAQAAPRVEQENTKELCSDHLDNDGDGYEDCADQDCQELTICANHAAAQVARPVPAYAGEAMPMRRAVDHQRAAHDKILAGTLMLTFSLAAFATSGGPYWYATTQTGSFDAGPYYGSITAGVFLNLIGFALFGAGSYFLATGSGELGAAGPAPASAVGFAPSVGSLAPEQSGGFKVSF